MEVIVARSAGFCFGVKRAVEEVNRQIEEGQKPVYTYGPIIHNEHVVNSLAARGVQVIQSEEELDAIHHLMQQRHRVILQGMGGIGKTELVKRYAVLHADEYETIL